MKILHCVESYFPALGGMQEVVKQLSERLVKLGHEVTVATRLHPERKTGLLNGVKIVSFNIGGNIVNGIEGEGGKYEKFLLESDFDIVTFFAAQQWATDLALPLLDRIRGKKISVPTGYSGFYWTEYKAYFEKMKSWIHQYDMNVYLSNDYRDINFARQNGVTKICLIPNGAAEDEFIPATTIDVRKELGVDADEFLVLHVGSFTGWKGHHESIKIFLRSGLKKATLLMIGNNSENFGISRRRDPLLYLQYIYNKLLGKRRVIFRYFPREFTVAAYRQSDIFLFPSNLECSPIVLFECAAAGLPFLATDVGNTNEIAQWTGGGIIVPTVRDREGFSHAVIKEAARLLYRMWNDKKLRKEMGAAAFTAWREKYSWEKIALQYEAMYLTLLNGSNNKLPDQL
jgi:glycosyltransferase involved in cell wall biosynthesis